MVLLQIGAPESRRLLHWSLNSYPRGFGADEDGPVATPRTRRYTDTIPSATLERHSHQSQRVAVDHPLQPGRGQRQVALNRRRRDRDDRLIDRHHRDREGPSRSGRATGSCPRDSSVRGVKTTVTLSTSASGYRLVTSRRNKPRCRGLAAPSGGLPKRCRDRRRSRLSVSMSCMIGCSDSLCGFNAAAIDTTVVVMPSMPSSPSGPIAMAGMSERNQRADERHRN
jgi:hypothetical protein